MLGVYRRFAEELMAFPVLAGVKTAAEKFAGAVDTYAIEAMMQDGKALQSGSSHNLGQNFARAFEVRYQNEDGRWEHVWNTSWGMSTRVVGAVVMSHGDDNGIVLPPRIAPIQVVIVPIWRGDDPKDAILEAASRVRDALKTAGISVRLDARDNLTPGAKYHDCAHLARTASQRALLGQREYRTWKRATVAGSQKASLAARLA